MKDQDQARLKELTEKPEAERTPEEKAELAKLENQGE